MPWEISVTLVGAALLVLAGVAVATLVEIRRSFRKVAELTATLDRRLPAILQNIEEINRNAGALTASIQALSGKTAETGKEFDRVISGVHSALKSLGENVLDPALKTLKRGSTLLAIGVSLRRLRHPLRLWRRRGRGKGKGKA